MDTSNIVSANDYCSNKRASSGSAEIGGPLLYMKNSHEDYAGAAMFDLSNVRGGAGSQRGLDQSLALALSSMVASSAVIFQSVPE